MQVGESLNGISEGPLVDLRVFGEDAVADSTVGDGRKLKIHRDLQPWRPARAAGFQHEKRGQTLVTNTRGILSLDLIVTIAQVSCL
jgi:hypothetical protein